MENEEKKRHKVLLVAPSGKEYEIFFSESIRSHNQATVKDTEKPEEGATEGQQRLPSKMLYTVVFSGICCGFLVVPLVEPICGKACGGAI